MSVRPAWPSHTDWPSYQFDPQHTAFNSLDRIRFPLEEVWKVSVSTDPLGLNSTTIAEGIVYAGSIHGEVAAFERDSGLRLWSFRARGSIHLAPAVIKGKVIFGSADGFLRALDSKTGQPIWSFNAGSNIHTSPTALAGRVYFGSNSGRVFALDVETGKLIWEQPLGDYIWSSPAADDRRVYVAALDGRIFALDKDSGEVAWRAKTADRIRSSPSVSGGWVFIGSHDGTLRALHADTGALAWAATIGAPIVDGLAVNGEAVFAASLDGKLRAFSKGQGSLIWEFPTGGPIHGGPAIIDAVVLVGSDDGTLHALDAPTGVSLSSTTLGGRITAPPALSKGRVLILTNDGTLHALRSPNQPPGAPANLLVNSRSNPAISTSSAAFAWTFRDPDKDDAQSAFRLQVASATRNFGVPEAESGFVESATTQFTLTRLLPEGTYFWRVQTFDLFDDSGPFTSGEDFFIWDRTPPEISISSPIGGERFIATVNKIQVDFSVMDNLDPNPNVEAALVQIEDQGSPRGQRADRVLVSSGAVLDPFSIDDGIWRLEVKATDFATNVSSRASGAFEVIHDIQPPRTVVDIGEPKFSTASVFITRATPLQLASEDDLIEVGDRIGLGVAFQEGNIRGITVTHERRFRFENLTPKQRDVFVSTVTASQEPDGLYALEFFAEDIIGNREQVKITTIAVDNTAPRTEIVLGVPRFITQEGMRFITSRTPMGFEAVDPVVSSVASGVRLTEFSVDGGSFTVFGSSFPLSEGVHTVAFRSVDNLGNTEEPKTVELRVDDTAPITELISTEKFFTDSFGRNYANPFFLYRLDARDPVVKDVASGVAFTRFSTLTLVGTQDVFTTPDPPLPPLRPYDPNNPLFALDEGIKRVDFQSQDNVQNLELLKGTTIFVDATPPISTLAVSSPSCIRNDGFVVSSKTQLVVDAADPQSRGVASGVFQSFFKENGGQTLSRDFRTGQTSPFFLSPSKPDGFVEVSFFSADNVANAESPKTRTLVLDNTPPKAFFLSPTTSTANPGLCKLLGGTQIKIIGTVTDKRTHPPQAPGGIGASFDHFESYTLEFGFGAEPSFFTLITSSVTNRSLESEVLGVWDATSLPEGVYTLRLTARDCVQNEIVATIQVIVSKPRIVLSLGKIGNGTGEFNQPSYIAVDLNTQDIWISDTNNDRIQKFTSSGTFITEINPTLGSPSGKLKKPTGVAADPLGDVWVADRNNNRVLRFSKTGSFLLELQGTGFNKPHGLALDSQGNIFVADRNNDRIQKFSPQGNLLLTINTGIQDDLNKPQGVLAVDHLHQLYITDRNNDRVLVYSSTGGFIRQLGNGSGSGPGQFNKPDGIALNGLAFAYVADQNNSRIQKFDPFGNVVLIFNMPQNQDEVLNHPGGLATDKDGNLWIADSNNGKVKKFAPEGDLIVIASQDQAKDQPAKKFIAKAQGGAVFHAKGAKVDIPAQALPQDMEIIVDAAQNPPKTQGLRVLAGGTRQEVKTIGQAVEYGPSGTQFSQPVTLTVPYDPRTLGWASEDDLTVAYFNPSSGEWEPVQSSVDKTLKVVRAQTTHFSLYAVMAPLSADPAFQLGEVYSFPNPARNGRKPTLHIEAGIADSVNIKIYDVAGELVHETALSGLPQIINDPNGISYAYEYTWDQHIPTGVYLYVVTAQKGSEKIKRTGRLSVVR